MYRCSDKQNLSEGRRMYLLMVFGVEPTLRTSLRELFDLRPTNNNPENLWAHFSTKDERITTILKDLRLQFSWYEAKDHQFPLSKDKGLIDLAKHVPNGFRTQRQDT